MQPGREPAAEARSPRVLWRLAQGPLTCALGAACAIIALTVCTSVHAQDAPPATLKRARPSKDNTKHKAEPTASKAEIKAQLAAAQALLGSDQRDQIEAGIQSLGLLGVAEAVDPLAARIRDGLPSELLELAITTLTALGQVKAGPVLAQLTTHRRPEVRRQAIEALAAAPPSDCEAVMMRALSDSDAQVRSAAAVALRDVGTSRSLERLFRALDRGNGDAAPAIGKLVDPHNVDQLYPYLGKVGFRQLSPALTTVLKRKDIAERDKLELLARLQEVATHEVKVELDQLLASSRSAFSPAVQRALARVVQDIAN